MNDKLCNHVNILFAAAPRNQKAEEIKEELLTNLNDKYNDLLSNGYDSTAAFHIALSGIGDIDELLKECGGTVQADAPSIIPKPQASQIPMLLVLAFNLFCIFPSLPMFLMGPVPSIFGSIFLLWGFAGSVLVYAIASSFIGRSGKTESASVSPMFSKHKMIRMSLYLGLAICLFILVEAFRASYPYRGFELLGLLGYLVALGFYICALVALVKKEPVQIEANSVSAVPPVLPSAKPSRMPVLLALAFGLAVLGPVLGVAFPGPRTVMHGGAAHYYGNAIALMFTCWGIAGCILVYAIATLFTGRYGIVWFILAIVLASVLSALFLFYYFAYVF